MAKGIWVFAEVKGGNVRKITYELLSQGKKMAGKLGEELVAVLLGSGVEGLTGRLSEYADKVYWVDDPNLAQYTTDAYATVLTNLLKEHQPSIFLCGATLIGKDLSPRIATRLQAGLATDCTGLSIGEDGLMIAKRPVYAGKAFIEVTCPISRPQMASVRPNVLEMLPPDGAKKGAKIKV
jgi:electron transfer flavoprotein alpha subunit